MKQSSGETSRENAKVCLMFENWTGSLPLAMIYHPHAEEAAQRPSRSTRATSRAFILRDARKSALLRMRNSIAVARGCPSQARA